MKMLNSKDKQVKKYKKNITIYNKNINNIKNNKTTASTHTFQHLYYVFNYIRPCHL